MKKSVKKLLSLGLSMVVSATIFASIGVTAFAYTETTGTVSTDNVKVRESASTTASQVSSLKNGDKVDIIDEATDASGYVWYKIRVNKSETGYVRSALISKAGGSSSSATTATTTTNTSQANGAAASLPATTVTTTDTKTGTTLDNVNVRQGAGTAYDAVGKVAKGDTVTITGEATGTDNKTWYQVTFGNDKQGFIRSDLLQVSEAAPAENTEAPAEGGEAAPAEGGEGEAVEAVEGGEGEATEGGEDQSQGGAEVTSEAGDGTYSLVYLTDEEGTGIWYLYDNVEGYRVKVNELIEAAKSSDEVNKLVKTNNNYKTIVIILAVLILALVVGLVLLALKLRDSLYYEDEPEEEYDRYAQPSRRRARDAEEEEEDPRQRARRTATEERTVRPSREREEAERPVRTARREPEIDERAARRPRPAEYDEERASRRSQEERPVRTARRDEDDDLRERQPRRTSYRAQEQPKAREEAPRRKAKNFLGDEQDFEFEFLDLDDDK